MYRVVSGTVHPDPQGLPDGIEDADADAPSAALDVVWTNQAPETLLEDTLMAQPDAIVIKGCL